MTREEREQALEWFKNRPVTMLGAKKMYDLAFEALSADGDTISRQAAIDALNKLSESTYEVDYGVVDCDDAIGEIEQLPPAQPAQPEIIRCKDCKHRDPEDKKCDCGHDIQWQLPRRGNWYCADAERREVTT